jgi:hypothetical protein
MSVPQRNLLLAFAAVLALGFAGVAWWLVQTPLPPSTGTAPAPIAQPLEKTPAAPERNVELAKVEAEAPAATTVVFPLQVELELLASQVRPNAEGVGALGSEATARLTGSVHGSSGEGLQAEILFLAGPNCESKDGRRLMSGRDGTFGANDLYPGLSVVKITAPGTPGSQREVLLRRDRETQLNVGYGRLGTVQGMVKDATGDPLPGARVVVDGQETTTDERGEFVFPGVASGETFVVVEKPGFAAHMERMTVVAGATVEKNRLVYALRPGARLEITIEDRINVESEAWLSILPQTMNTDRDFPWFRLNPVRLYPGGTKVIEDLPSKAVTLRLFHSGAVASPPTRSVTLKEKEMSQVSLHLVPAPIVNGVVTEGGRPVSGAEVVLETPQRSKTQLSIIGESNYYDLEKEVLPDFPAAVQSVKTNAAGEFVVNSNEGASRDRYLHALSPDGKSTAWKLLRGGETRVDLALEPAQGECEFILQMAGRTQGLPVEAKVDGAPRDKQILPPGRDLHLAGLAAGTWRVTVKWNGEPLVDGMLIDLRKETSLSVTLPAGAIQGQDEDTRKRSGK